MHLYAFDSSLGCVCCVFSYRCLPLSPAMGSLFLRAMQSHTMVRRILMAEYLQWSTFILITITLYLYVVCPCMCTSHAPLTCIRMHAHNPHICTTHTLVQTHICLQSTCMHAPHVSTTLCTTTRTVSNDQLRGGCDYSRAQVLQFVNMADNEVLPSVCTWVFPTMGIMQYNANVS